MTHTPASSIVRANRFTLLLGCIFLAIVMWVGITLLFFRLALDANNQTTGCLKAYAKANADRNAVLQPYNLQMNAAQSIYNRTRDDHPRSIKLIDQLRSKFEAAQSELALQLALHPAPDYNCGGKTSQSTGTPSSIPYITTTNTATTTKTRTVKVPTTASVFIPGPPVQTVVVPGRGHGHDVTTTRTVAVSPSKTCLVNQIPICLTG